MGEWKPLYISLFMLLILGGLLPYIMASFIDINSYSSSYDGYLDPIITFVGTGTNLDFSIPIPFLPNVDFDFDFNPFGLLGGNIQNFLVNQLVGFSLIPSVLGIFLIVIMSVGFVYSIIKLLPLT